MNSSILMCWIAILLPTGTHQIIPDYSVIKRCKPPGFERATKKPPAVKYPTGAEVARTGNYFGLVPQSYNLHLSFVNGTHYNGTVAIAVLVKNFTRIIAVNIDMDSIKFDFANTMIEADFSHIEATYNCIEKFDYDNITKTLVIDLETRLWKDYRYIIHLKDFQGHAYDVQSQKGAVGLRQYTAAESSTTYTDFAPNNARTVFPCMDHITLRAKFQLCLEYMSSYTVVSSTEPLEEPVQAGDFHLATCFEDTEPIPTYIFSFALIDNYIYLKYDKFPGFGVLSPPDYISFSMQMISYATNAIEYMKRITGKNMPVKIINFLLVFGNATMNTNNAGLIPVPGEQVLANFESSDFYKGFFRAIVNQWLGPITTVSHWGEACLQEGLAEYFNWFLLKQNCNQSIAVKAKDISKKHVVPKSGWVTDDINGVLTKEELKKCHEFPPLFFNTIAQFYNVSVLERLLKTLLGRKTYSFARLDDWDAYFSVSIPAGSADWKSMEGYISGWFKAGSRVTVEVTYNRFSASGKCIPHDDQNCDVVIPLLIHTSFSDVPFQLVLRDGHGSIVLPDEPQWVYVEANGTELMMKLYNVSNYDNIFTFIHNEAATASRYKKPWKNELFDEFCRALTRNYLPIEMNCNPADWQGVFRNANLLNISCSCCLTTEEAGRSCEYADECDRISIRHRMRFGLIPYTS